MLKFKVLSYYHCGKLKSDQTQLELTETESGPAPSLKTNTKLKTMELHKLLIKFKVVIIAVSCSRAEGTEESLDQRPVNFSANISKVLFQNKTGTMQSH